MKAKGFSAEKTSLSLPGHWPEVIKIRVKLGDVMKNFSGAKDSLTLTNPGTAWPRGACGARTNNQYKSQALNTTSQRICYSAALCSLY